MSAGCWRRREIISNAGCENEWEEVFSEIRAVRRSTRLAEGWERDGTRLFLAPKIYGEALLIQYLVSRSQAHGG